MNEADQWDLDSEAMRRFYRALVAFEDDWRRVKLTRFRYVQWKLRRQFREPPPVCHNRTVWGESSERPPWLRRSASRTRLIVSRALLGVCGR